MKPNSPDYEVYFDFDNTVTLFDVVDDVVQRYAMDDSWITAESDWQAGKIGSKECLARQFGVVRVTKELLSSYLATVPIDSAFKPLLGFLREKKVPTKIVSDGFEYFIETILQAHGVSNLEIRANEIDFTGDRIGLRFPHSLETCAGTANCKCSHLALETRAHGRKKIYIGDGKSDICAATACDIVFAKQSLLKHFTERNLSVIPFDTLSDVHATLVSLYP